MNRFFSFLLIPALSISGNLLGVKSEPVIIEVLGNHNGSEVSLFTLTNKSGNILKLTNYGARIVCKSRTIYRFSVKPDK